MEPTAKHPTFRESGAHIKATKWKSKEQRMDHYSQTVCPQPTTGRRPSPSSLPMRCQGKQDGLLCPASCGESNRQGHSLARNEPASHSLSENSDCVPGNPGVTAFLWEHPSLCSQAPGKSKAFLPWCWFLTKYTSDPARSLDRNKYIGSIYNPHLL